MKKGAMIIDISCDAHGGIETSEATTIDHPTYEVEGILHYVVDHTPSLFYKTASQGISEEVGKYLDDLCERKENPILTDRKSTRLNSSHITRSRMPSSA